MPLQARPELLGISLHISQRGVPYCFILLDGVDRRHYVDLFGERVANHGLRICTHVLRGDHMDPLVSSGESGHVSLAMYQLGQPYVAAFDRRHRCTGTPWVGRRRPCLVGSDSYLLAAYRPIELNPVLAAMTEKPGHHHCSGVHANLARFENSPVTAHPGFSVREIRRWCVPKPAQRGSDKALATTS